MITIATYTNVADAHIAKGLLEANDIKCQLRNESVAQTLPLGVELLVEEEDIENALAVLKESEL